MSIADSDEMEYSWIQQGHYVELLWIRSRIDTIGIHEGSITL